MEFVTRENKLMNLTVGKEMNLIASKEYASIIKHAYITKFKQINSLGQVNLRYLGLFITYDKSTGNILEHQICLFLDREELENRMRMYVETEKDKVQNPFIYGTCPECKAYLTIRIGHGWETR